MYCSDCSKKGREQKMKLTMLNFTCGVWLCPMKDCTFPLAAENIGDYIKENVCQQDTRKQFHSSHPTAHRSTRKKRQNTKLTATQRLRKNSVESMEGSNQTSMSESNATDNEQKCPQNDKELTLRLSSDSDSALSRSSDGSVSSRRFPLWQNANSLCWLDVSLILLCHNGTLRRLTQVLTQKAPDSLLNRLYASYDVLLARYNETDSYSAIKRNLAAIREQFWNYLQPKLSLKKGDQDSPLFALPLLLREDRSIYEQIEQQYTVNFKCSSCKMKKSSTFKKALITLPNCCDSFSIPHSVGFLVNCYYCGSAVQKSFIHLDGRPPLVMFHFTQGVPHASSWREYDFELGEDTYKLMQIVQYVNRHFICWCYNVDAQRWLRSDDLSDQVGSFSYFEPKCPFQEGHILIWERDGCLDIDASRTSVDASCIGEVTNEDTGQNDNLKSSVAAEVSHHPSDEAYFFDGNDTSTLLSTTAGDSYPREKHKAAIINDLSLDDIDILSELSDVTDSTASHHRKHCGISDPVYDSAYSSPCSDLSRSQLAKLS